MRELNRSRNAFSHSAAQSEAQANTWIVECLEDVYDVLDDLRGLADLHVLRYTAHKDGNTLRCEVFRGHSGTKTLRDIPLTQDQVSRSSRYFNPGQVLAVCDSHIVGLRPFVYFRIDPSGHATKLCLYRKARGEAPNRRLEYEVVGDAVRHQEDRITFKQEIDELRALFAMGPE